AKMRAHGDQRIEAAHILDHVLGRANDPDAELVLPTLVNSHLVVGGEPGLELLRRLVEDVREEHTPGRRRSEERSGSERAHVLWRGGPHKVRPAPNCRYAIEPTADDPRVNSRLRVVKVGRRSRNRG